jgi:CRISPR-associated protein Csh2
MIYRSELIFLYDIKDNNPNGDPLDNNKPRIDEETSINIVTDVRLKRTIRDYLYEYKGQEIFVREIRDEKGNVQDAKTRAKDFGKDKDEVIKNVLEQCIDVRLFGATIPLEFSKEETGSKKETSSATFTGPVQFNMGRSLHQVVMKRIKGTGAFAAREGKEQKTFREEYILPYSLIGFYGIINEHAAESTRLKQEDIDMLIEAMWNGTKNLISRSKVGQVPRLLLKIDYKEDNFHIGDLLKDIKLIPNVRQEEIRDVEDYALNLQNLLDTLKTNREKVHIVYYKVDKRLNLQGELAQLLKNAGLQAEELNL